MSILHTITCTIPVNDSNGRPQRYQVQRSLIRTRRLTDRGIERMLKHGCTEWEPNAEICLCRVETAVFAI